MPICRECHYFGFDDFIEVTEESILADLTDPEAIEESMSSVGTLICPECGSTDVLTD